jgi:tRNA(Arg) A34 adenosine deaminase TadA
MCLAAIYWARLGAIYFGGTQEDAAKAGFDDAFLYEEFRKSTENRSIPSVQLLQTEAWRAFATWLAVPTKVDY